VKVGGRVISRQLQGDSKPVSAEQFGRLQEIPQGFLQVSLADLSPDRSRLIGAASA
jgi:hypothetical protein